MDWLVVCGIDGALLGDNPALATLNETMVAHRSSVVLAYLTGRSFTSVMGLKEHAALLPADYLICEGGTSLWQRTETGYAPVLAWMNLLNGDWNRNRVEAIAHRFGLEEQPSTHQGPFKCSYYLSPVLAERLLPQIEAQVEMIDAYMVYNAGFLDILPTNSAEVVDYLRSELGIAEEQTVVCGSALADDHVAELEIKRVVVPTQPLAAARNGQRIYYAQQSLALGVLEGLAYWGVLGG